MRYRCGHIALSELRYHIRSIAVLYCAFLGVLLLVSKISVFPGEPIPKQILFHFLTIGTMTTNIYILTYLTYNWWFEKRPRFLLSHVVSPLQISFESLLTCLLLNIGSAVIWIVSIIWLDLMSDPGLSGPYHIATRRGVVIPARISTLFALQLLSITASFFVRIQASISNFGLVSLMRAILIISFFLLFCYPLGLPEEWFLPGIEVFNTWWGVYYFLGMMAGVGLLAVLVDYRRVSSLAWI